MIKRTILWLACVVMVAAVLVVLGTASGVRFFTVLTPSMGQAAPVGTLVVTLPATEYRSGEIVTYQRNNRTYTHRIVEVGADATFVTKGDLNTAADPLRVAKTEVVGRAIWIAPGIGWLWQGLPWLALGGLLVYALSLLRQFDPTWRWVIRISGWTLTLCLVVFWLRPWVGLAQLSWSPSELGGVDMRVVNTGIFPLDLLGERVVSGQDAIVHVTEQDTRGQYALTPGLAFHWWEQLALLLICLIPLALSFLVREPRAVESTRAEGSAPDPSTDAAAESRAQVGLGDMDDRRRVILIGAVVLAIIASVAVVTFTTTNAALTARVTNTANTAGTRLTCRGALTSVGASSSVFAFALVPTGIAARTETDLAGNTTGTYKVAPVPYTSPVGCTQDDPLTAVTFSSSTAQCLSSTAASSPALSTFSLEAWFRTNTTTAPTAGFGKIIGFGGSANSPIESSYDRHVYLNASGQVVFGTYQDGYRTINSSSSKADQAWHHVMATFSAATGMILYVDGVVAASNTSYATAESTAGYWKVGCGNLNGWPSPGGTTATSGGITYRAGYFNGTIQYAAVFKRVLSAGEVQAHYQAGRP